MGIRTGKDSSKACATIVTVYVDGERVKDVTGYPPFRRYRGDVGNRCTTCSMSVATN